jgi:tetratricopeptide (TPR) repeat protein
VPGKAGRPGSDIDEAEGLLALAVSRPREALIGARALLDRHPSGRAASAAHQAAGIVLRDLGELGPAIREFRLALRIAGTTGERSREADVLASLGIALTMRGRTDDGLAALTEAVDRSRGSVRARVLMRRGAVLSLLGRHRSALSDLDAAVEQLRRSQDAADRAWEARARLTRTMSLMSLGEVRRAEADAARAEELFTSAGQDLESAMATHNRGLVAYRSGLLPQALGFLSQAEKRYVTLEFPAPELAQERCEVLLAAGLAEDALREVEHALEQRVPASKRADLLFAAATAALAAGDVSAARQRAVQARRMFRTQRRDWWCARAEYIVMESRYADGDRGRQLLRDASSVAARLEDLRAEEAPHAHLLAGRFALRSGEVCAAESHLARAAAARFRGPALSRATGWLAQALREQAAGRRGGVTRSCARGLDALDEHRLTLGGSELRALSTGHGRELARLALRAALDRGDVRQQLRWSERWRATALAVPPVRPPEDAELAADLAALRETVARLAEARADGTSTVALERERGRLESEVRRRRHHQQGVAGGAEEFNLDALFEALGDTQLLELFELDGDLHAIVSSGRRLNRFRVGPVEAAVRETEFARFELRRAARGRPVDTALIGARLQEALIGAAATALGEGPVLVVPPGQLHAVPWALAPALDDRPVAVSPSSALWIRARRATVPEERRVALVLGPGLGSAGAELPGLAALYPGAQRLGGGSATAQQVLAALDGSWLAHVAAHGDFRADSPLFSALQLDDGPLTVHDLERLRHAPYRIVLSACDSGVAAAVGADELLGLVSGLLPLGTAGILASIVLVNDAATVPLMLAVHASLKDGRGLSEALLDARRATADDPLLAATGASFLALGV